MFGKLVPNLGPGVPAGMITNSYQFSPSLIVSPS